MKKNNVRRMARKLKRDLHGDISLISLMEYSKRLGYNVIFFNTPEGDKLVNFYELEYAVKVTPALTVAGEDNLILVDGNKPYCDKIYLFLHELGHILLGHIGDGNIGLKDKPFLEAEANAFVYEVATHNNILMTALREIAEKIKLTYQSASLAAGNGGQLPAPVDTCTVSG